MRTTFFLSLFFLPFAAYAHEKWFIDTIDSSLQKPALFSQWSAINGGMAAAALAICGIAFAMHGARRTWDPAVRIKKELTRHAVWVPTALRTMTGTVLFTGSFQRFLFAPDLTLHSIAPTGAHIFATLQLLIGLALILGCVPRITAACGLMLYLSAFFMWPFISVISSIGLAGIFIYIFIVGDPYVPKAHRVPPFPAKLVPYAMPLLRICMGVGFMVVGAYYKIIQPAYALAFLKMHPINFMPALGFDFFTDGMFVLAAGLTEVLVGALITAGVLPRFLGAVLFALFLGTLGLFGVYELLGHLPLFAFAFALMTAGAGRSFLRFPEAQKG